MPNTITQNLINLLLFLIALAIPILIGKIVIKLLTKPLKFKSVRTMFFLMPFGLKKAKAKGIDIVIQFYLTGQEKITSYLTIKNQKASFKKGEHKNPNTTIKTKSETWLAIANKELSPAKAYFEKLIEVSGDESLLLKLTSLFEKTKKQKTNVSSFKFGTLKPNTIKDILVIDGGPRNDDFSKSTFIAKKFCEGAKTAGANINYIDLKTKNINPCVGCFTCWSKTPEKCIYDDDMPELLKLVNNADLLVFVTPLYVFSVCSQLKKFLDRIIPNLQPYLEILDGTTIHPLRHPTGKDQGIVVFSASGFPEIADNFDGISAIFRCFDKHSEKTKLLGEFFLPAAETLAHPMFIERRNKVEKACFEAGAAVVIKGKVDQKYIRAIQELDTQIEEFKDQANNFWGIIEGKKAYANFIPKLYSNIPKPK
jgi:putative sterol carrier protein